MYNTKELSKTEFHISTDDLSPMEKPKLSIIDHLSYNIALIISSKVREEFDDLDMYVAEMTKRLTIYNEKYFSEILSAKEIADLVRWAGAAEKKGTNRIANTIKDGVYVLNLRSV